MESVNYTLVFVGGGVCAFVIGAVIAGRRAARLKPVRVRLTILIAAGVVCFAGSQILGRGLIGWWPVLGQEKVFVRLVRVAVSPRSGRIALIAFGGHRGKVVRSSARLFVAERDGDDIHRVCEGDLRDIHWSRDGEELYVLRGGMGRGRKSLKSLWRYSPSTRRLSYVRELPRRTVSLNLDAPEKNLLFTSDKAGDVDGKVLLVRGPLGDEAEDRDVCWRTSSLGGYAWGPRSGSIFVATDEASSFGELCGLWMVEGDGERSSRAAVVLEMGGIEEINLDPAERHAALVVRRRPRPSLEFDLYVLDLTDGLAKPLAPGVEWGSTVWDNTGEKLVFADGDGLKSYRVSTGRVRLLVEAPRSRINPDLRERLRPLSCRSSGDVVFQAGFDKVEIYDGETGQARVLLDVSRLRRYFKGLPAELPAEGPVAEAPAAWPRKEGDGLLTRRRELLRSLSQASVRASAAVRLCFAG